MTIEDNVYKGLTFVMDVDGTLCPLKTEVESYADLVPYPEMVARVRMYHDAGARIVLHTSRNMNSYKGNIGVINKETAPIMLSWLDKWDIPYDEIVFGKPWPGKQGFYVDDRSVRPDEFLRFDIEKLTTICGDSRCNPAPAGMAVVITMAGSGSRFRKAGWDCPKYMIQAKGKTLFEWSMESLTDYLAHSSRCVFVVKAEDHARSFIEEQCSRLGIQNAEILELDAPTDGQATTCYLAAKHCRPSEPLMVYNIDTYVESGGLVFADIAGDGHIPCFKADGDHWSFAKVNAAGVVTEVREKQRISDNCTLGAYYFSSTRLFCDLYNEWYADDMHLEKGEKYVAPLYNFMIKKGMQVTISNVPADKVHVLGTPAELDAFLSESEGTEC